MSVLFVGSEVTLIDFHFMRCSGAEYAGAFEAVSSARATMIRGSVTVSPRYHLHLFSAPNIATTDRCSFHLHSTSYVSLPRCRDAMR